MRGKAGSRYGFGWIYARTRGIRRYLACLAFAGAALAAVNMIMAGILKNFVDIAVGASHTVLAANLVSACLILVLEGVMRLLTAASCQVSCNRSAQWLRQELMGRLYGSRLQELEKHHVGEYMTNLTTDVEKVCGCIPTLVKDTVGNGLSAVLAVAYLLYLNWKLALLLIICIPLLMACIAVFSPILQKTGRRDKENEEEIRVWFQNVLDKIKLFKLGAMGEKIEARSQKLLEAKVKSALRFGLAEGGSAFLNNVLGSAMFLIAMGGGAYFVTRGELEVGAMIAVVQLCNYIIWPFTAVGDIISNVSQAMVSAERLDRIYSLPEEPEQIPAPGKGPCMLRLRDVSFCYGDAPVLEGIDAYFGKMGITGIVGESGGGKSTLLKVISGLYLPEKGAVSAVFEDGSEWNDVRPYVGLVPSAGRVYRDTIEANICMAQEPDEARMERCAAMANIDRFIGEQKEGYSTVIGDGSQALSSGQEQRIGIARALYQGAEILLFDEPTANLDAESVEIFLDTLDKVSGDRICIVATHDPKVVKRCSRVLEVKDGKLCERGSA